MTYSGDKVSQLEITMDPSKIQNLSTLDVANFHVQYAILSTVQSQLLESPFDGFINLLYINPQDSCITPYFINHHTFLIKGGENIIHATKQCDIIEWKNINSLSKAIIIFIPRDIIPEFASKYEEQINRFTKGYITKTDNRIQLISNQIIDTYQQENNLKELRIQSLLIDAIVHQIEGLIIENDKHEVITNKNHYDFVIMAKQLIEKDLSINYTIPELSKLVGTNEQYLKKYFKQYFGKTIMNYITEKKMNHAKELIMTGEYRVVDVARLTGYKHSTHFTTAFKKYFGFIPNSLKYTFLLANENSQKIISEIENILHTL